jgi:hypothetical protein
VISTNPASCSELIKVYSTRCQVQKSCVDMSVVVVIFQDFDNSVNNSFCLSVRLVGICMS